MDNLEERFVHKDESGDGMKRHAEIDMLHLELARKIDRMLPDCREKSLALTKLEACKMWVNAGVSRRM
ncbi:MAG: hypothetical protein GF388_08535 [Candidatus Aegiribacteria sp.]|nr:hypothetical protein [Candidatus Aegiribacteria sp.]